MAKVNITEFTQQMRALERAFADLPEAAHKEFVKNTPIRSGNARRNTRLEDTKIIADYPYSQRLEDNYSPQTRGKGIVKPTEDWIQQEVDRRLKGI